MVKKTATCFYLPNGNPWSGPVHEHDGTWMAGARHTSRPHPVLNRVQHNNVKVQDYRIFSRLERIQNNISLSEQVESRRIFSDLFLSRDADSAARGLLAMNIERFLTSSSRFNKLFSTADVNKLMPYTEIQSLKIVRTKVEKKGANDFDFANQEDVYEIVAESNDHPTKKTLIRKDNFIDENMDSIPETYIGTVSEKRLAGLGKKRAFSFYDSKIREFEAGEYRYGIEVSMTDPTIKYMELQMRGLRKAHEILSDYYHFANNRRYFNHQGKFHMQALEFLAKAYGSSVKIEKRNSFNYFPWRRAVKIYLKVLSELTGANTKVYARRLYAILGPSSGGLEGVEAFLSLLAGLIQKLASYGIVIERPYSDKRSKAKSNKKQEASLLETTHYFDNTFDAGIVKEYGIDYYGDFLTKNYTGPMTISMSAIQRRFEKEAERMGTTRPRPQNMAEYRKFHSTLSPIRVRTNTEVYNLEDMANTSPETLRRVKAQVLKMRKRADNQGVRTPDNGGSTYEMLRSMLRQQGVGATVQMYKAAKEDPCDPEVKVPATSEAPKQTDTSKFLPGGKDDNFTAKESNRPSDNTQSEDNSEADVSIEILEALAVGETSGDILGNTDVTIRYITNFTDDMELEHVDAPFGNESQLAILENVKAQEEKDTINTTVIVGSTDTTEPEYKDIEEEPKQEVPIETEEPKDEEYTEEPDDTMDTDDNAETSTNVGNSTGSEEVASKATTGPAIRRDAVVQAPPTVARTEQQQTYLVGVASTSNTGTGGGGDAY